jgi:hypothetical protein
MNFRYLLLFLSLLIMVSFADVAATNPITCNPSFSDTMTIRALDAASRPIQGADIYVRYQYSGSQGVGTSGSTYYVAGPLKTNADGTVVTTVYNIENDPNRIDCVIDINGSIGGTLNTTQVYANYHPSIIDIGIPVYITNIFVRETTGGIIRGAPVTINGLSKTTDANGFTQFYLPVGEFPYLVSYLDGKQAGTITVTGDTTYYALLKSYSISISVIDDAGNPLNATLTIGNQTVQLGSDGLYTNPKVFGNQFDFTAVYNGVSKKSTIFPETSESQRIVFDFSAPTIGNLTKTEEGGKVKLTFPVTDPGAYASGVDPASLSVTYREVSVNGTGQWNKATAYVVSKGVFAAEFPQFSPNTVVEFKLEIADIEGNRASVGGRFAVAPPVPPQQNGTSTGNGTSTNQPPQTEGPGLPILYIVGGVVMIAFLAYMFFRLKKGGD